MSKGEILDYNYWVESWEKQQNALIMKREERFDFMFDVVGQRTGGEPLILDLACGPGSLSGRFLSRFSGGRAVAVDYDPVLLHLAVNHEGYPHDRVEFISADLSSESWSEKLNGRKFDAVMSTTALHWIREGDLKRLYSTIRSLLKPSGVFMNGDTLHPLSEPAPMKDMFREMRHSIEERNLSAGDAMDWDQWWKKLSGEKMLSRLFEERARRYPSTEKHDQHIELDKHKAFLEEAGFSSVYVGWQHMDNRVLIALP